MISSYTTSTLAGAVVSLFNFQSKDGLLSPPDELEKNNQITDQKMIVKISS